jgi:hypothetical protein
MSISLPMQRHRLDVDKATVWKMMNDSFEHAWIWYFRTAIVCLAFFGRPVVSYGVGLSTPFQPCVLDY